MSIQKETKEIINNTNILEEMIKHTRGASQLASKYANSIVNKIETSLDKGQIKIEKTTMKLSLEKVTSSTKNISQNEQEQNSNQKSHRMLSNIQHKKIVRKLLKQQNQTSQRRRKNVSQLENKKRLDEQKQLSLDKQRFQRNNQQKRKNLMQKAKEREAQQQKRIIQLKQGNERFNHAKQQKHLYQIIEQKYNNSVLFPNLQQKKIKLKQMRQMKKPMSMSQINAFEKSYLQKKQQLQIALTDKRNSVVTHKYQPPMKSHKLTSILEQQIRLLQNQKEDKRKSLENKVKRFEEYNKYFKQKFPTKIVKRSVTPVLQQSRLKQIRDQRMLGKQYLQYSKKMKKNNSVSKIQSTQTGSINDTIQVASKASKRTIYFHNENITKSDIRQKRLNYLLSSKQMSDVKKISQLNIQVQKIDEDIKRAQVLSRLNNSQIQNTDLTKALLQSIQTKVKMLQIIENKQ